MVRYGSHASIGYSACHTPTVGTAHEANRIFANIINSDLIQDKKTNQKNNKPEFKVSRKIEFNKTDWDAVKIRSKSNDALKGSVRFKFYPDEVSKKIQENYSVDT